LIALFEARKPRTLDYVFEGMDGSEYRSGAWARIIARADLRGGPEGLPRLVREPSPETRNPAHPAKFPPIGSRASLFPHTMPHCGDPYTLPDSLESPELQ